MSNPFESFQWVVPPRGGRPFVGAGAPAVSDGDRWLALGLDRSHLVAWRGAGQEVTRIALPEPTPEVRGVVLGADRVAALCEDGVWIHHANVWSHYDCPRPWYGAFGDDGGLRFLTDMSVRCVEADGTERWSEPCHYVDPLVAVGDTVYLVAWGATLVIDAEGTIEELENDAQASPTASCRVGDAVVTLTFDEGNADPDPERALLIRRGEEESVVPLTAEWTRGPLVAVGEDAVLVGQNLVSLESGQVQALASATYSGCPLDAAASNGEQLWVLRGGAISTWRRGDTTEAGDVGLPHIIDWDAAPDGRLAVVVPGLLVLVAADGNVLARHEIPDVWQARFSPDGDRLAVLTREAPTVRLFDGAGAHVEAASVKLGEPDQAVFLPDGRLAVSKGFVIHLLNQDLTVQGTCTARKNGYAQGMDSLVAGGPWLVGLDTGGTLHVFQLPEAPAKKLAPLHTITRTRVKGCSMALEGDTLVTIGEATSRWDLATGECITDDLPIWEKLARGQALAWFEGALHPTLGGEPIACPFPPDEMVALLDGTVLVELNEGIARLVV